jgi:hypothetical protein
MLYLASSQGSADSADSGEVTPSLGQTCTKHPQIVSCKGDSEQHRARVEACWCCRMRSFVQRLVPKFHAESLSLFSIDFSTRYAQVV